MPEIANPSITVDNVSFAYGQQTILDHFSVHIPAGKITCLLGVSGVGKTTLLRLLADLMVVDKTYTFSGNIKLSHQQERAAQISYMPQQDCLMPWLSVWENILLSFRLKNKTISKHEQLQAEQLLEKVGLLAAKKKLPKQLSGGMRQRVSLVRTLLANKPIVLMDEPFSALDAITRMQLQNLACELLAKKTVVLITHDPLEALRIGDQIVVLKKISKQCNEILTLTTSKPRDLLDMDVMQHQQRLLQLLAEDNHVR